MELRLTSTITLVPATSEDNIGKVVLVPLMLSIKHGLVKSVLLMKEEYRDVEEATRLVMIGCNFNR
jgi:hypothetical protein